MVSFPSGGSQNDRAVVEDLVNDPKLINDVSVGFPLGVRFNAQSPTSGMSAAFALTIDGPVTDTPLTRE